MKDLESGDIPENEHGQALGYPGALPLDVEKYRHYVDEFDISEERKIELLQTLWSIMRSFVELGWGVDSVQKFIPALAEFSSQDDSGDVEQIIPTSQFNSAATGEAAKDEESFGIGKELERER